MRFALSALSLALFATSASAQQTPTAPSQSEAIAQSKPDVTKTTYFLIDASGSMEKRQTQLNIALEAKRVEAGTTRIIETRFGGDNGGVCGSPVVIGTTETGKFRDDTTQIGAALESALIAAGDGPADIFIFTDEEQSPRCGVDVCTVAERYLPKPGIFVQSVPIDSSPYDHNKISCIRSAQDVPEQAVPVPTVTINNERVFGSREEPDENLDLSIDANPIHFIEKWLWLIAFGMIAYSAISWGQQRQQDAVDSETATIRLDRLRMAALVDGNEAARNQLREEIEKINKGRDEEKAKQDDFKIQPWPKRYASYASNFGKFLQHHWLGAIGLAVVIALPLLSKGFFIGDFSFGRAQAHAWKSLDSSFAEAFSLIGIAIVFFAGSQFRRHREAIQKFELATEKANWAQIHLLAQQRSAIVKSHEKAAEDLNDLKLPMPSPPTFSIRKRRKQATEVDVTAFALVFQTAREIARGSKLNLAIENATKIKEEADKMSEIASGTVAPWTDPFGSQNAARFFAMLMKLRSEAIPEEQRELWSKFTESLKKSNYNQTSAYARQLAPLLLLKKNADPNTER